VRVRVRPPTRGRRRQRDGAAVEPGGAVGDQARRPHLHLAGRLRLLPPRYAPQSPPPTATSFPVLTSSSSQSAAFGRSGSPKRVAKCTSESELFTGILPRPASVWLRWPRMPLRFAPSPQLAKLNLRGFRRPPVSRNFPAKTMPIPMRLCMPSTIYSF
jgi:hypothetical protein